MEKINLAKLNIPKPVNVYLRQRLFKKLDAAKRYPVIWLTAPAGSGKTTLIATYLEYRNIPSLWYRLDHGDGDVPSFFHYLRLAVRNFSGDECKLLPVLSPDYMPGITVFSQNYFRELYRIIKPGSVIVFDNYQDAPLNSVLHKVIQTGLFEIPEGINVIIMSRTPPPKEMAKLQASHIYSAFKGDDLYLSLAESKAIATLKNKWRKISAETINTIHQQTRGWMAGLILLLEQNIEIQIPEKICNQNFLETVFNYFASEVFQNTNEEVQELLLKTAFLQKISIPEAERLTDNNHAGIILEDLAERNYFTLRFYVPAPLYEYHPLFQAFLRDLANKTFSPEQITELKRKTALLLIESNEVDEAVLLLLRIAAWDIIIPFLNSQAPSILKHGRNKTLADWILCIPDEIRDTQAYTLYWLGVSLLPYNPQECRNNLKKAYDLFKGQNDPAGIYLSWSGIVNSIILEFNNLNDLSFWIQELYHLQESFGRFPSDEIESITASAMFMAMLYTQSQHPDIEDWKNSAFKTSQKTGNQTLTALILTNNALHKMVSGKLKDAAAAIEEYRNLIKSMDVMPLTILSMKWIEAMYYEYSGRHKDCMEVVSDGLNISASTGVHVMDFMLAAHGGLSALDYEDHKSAEWLLNKMYIFSSKSPLVGTGSFHYMLAYKELINNNLSQAVLHSETTLKISHKTGSLMAEALAHLEVSHVMHELKRYKNALYHLRKGMERGEEAGNQYVKFVGLLTEAMFYLDKKDGKRGIESLRNALHAGSEFGYICTYTITPLKMADLCCKALQYGIETEYVQQLIKMRNLFPGTPPLCNESWPWKLKIYAFGGFKVEKDGVNLDISGKEQQKPLSLIKILLTSEKLEVKEEQIIDILWPDADGDCAHNALKTNLHRLRYNFGLQDVIHYKNNRVSLDMRHCWIDLLAIEKLYEDAGRMSKEGSKKKALELLDKINSLYKGEFLEGEEAEWLMPKRSRIKSRYLEFVKNFS